VLLVVEEEVHLLIQELLYKVAKVVVLVVPIGVLEKVPGLCLVILSLATTDFLHRVRLI
tara:strand:- start:861 stop:1037 length:177 start_codon:yes stop_codon:yes gene_type:complete